MSAEELDEYLEGIASAAFKREFEQDENVVRSLPFFATALGLAVAIFSQIAPRVTSLSAIGSAILGGILVGAGCFFLATLWCLFQIVRAREFKIPPDEEAFVAWAQELKGFYRNQRKSAETAAKLARDEARRTMIQAYAEAAVDNRRSNRHKFGYRAQGFTHLVILIALASASVGVIFVDRQWSTLSRGASDGEEARTAERGTPGVVWPFRYGEGTKAETPANPDGGARAEVSGRAGGEGVNDDR